MTRVAAMEELRGVRSLRGLLPCPDGRWEIPAELRQEHAQVTEAIMSVEGLALGKGKAGSDRHTSIDS